MLQQLRLMFFAYCGAVVLIGAVAAFVVDADDPPLSVTMAAVIVAVVGLASLVLPSAIPTALDGSSAECLAATYKTRFFVRMAIAETVALVGFVLMFLTGSVVPFVAALPFTAVGFARAAPTDGNLQRDQDALNATGAMTDLRTALS
jgi:hypothetical protein